MARVGFGSRISAVLAFDCRLGARLGNVQHGSRGMGNGLAEDDADGMRCLRMDACLSPSAERRECLHSERA